MTLHPCSSPPSFTHVALSAYLWGFNLEQCHYCNLHEEAPTSLYYAPRFYLGVFVLLFLTCLFQPHYFIIHSPHALVISLNTFITAICIHSPFTLFFHAQDSSACAISYCIIPCLDWLVCFVRKGMPPAHACFEFCASFSHYTTCTPHLLHLITNSNGSASL